VCLAFLFRDFSSISMTAMPAVLLAFGFHPIITGFLKKAFIPTSFSAATVPYFVPIGAAAILKAFESIKIKIEKTEISRKHVSIIILAVFLPEMFNFLSYMSGKYAELKNGLPWNNELKVFTQEQANLEAYKWTLENTDKEDVILCPDEYVQTNEGLRMYDRNSLLVAVVTGRRPYVLNHNYASYMVNSHERYQYANFILYSANDTERYYMAKYINLSYIAVDKIKDKEFKEFYGLENIFENSKYLIYKVM